MLQLDAARAKIYNYTYFTDNFSFKSYIEF